MLLLEYGGSDRSIFVQMPSALSIPMGMEKYDWRYYTEPEPGLGGRRLHTPRGKVLGGSSSINGLVYVRGNAQDYERWEAEGAPAGTTRPCCPTSAARRRAPTAATTTAAIRARCRHATARSRIRCMRPGSRPARRRAIRDTPDVNGHQQEGFGRLDMTVGGRAPLQRGECVPAARDEAPEPRRAHAGTRDAHPVRGAPRRRRRVSPGRRDADRCARGAK